MIEASVASKLFVIEVVLIVRLLLARMLPWLVSDEAEIVDEFTAEISPELFKEPLALRAKFPPTEIAAPNWFVRLPLKAKLEFPRFLIKPELVRFVADKVTSFWLPIYQDKSLPSRQV